jgi:hypothetical protein
VIEIAQGFVDRLSVTHIIEAAETDVTAYEGQLIFRIEVDVLPFGVGVNLAQGRPLVATRSVMMVEHPFEAGKGKAEDAALAEGAVYLGKKDQRIALGKVFDEILTEAVFKPAVRKRVGAYEIEIETLKPRLPFKEEVYIRVKPAREHIETAGVMYLLCSLRKIATLRPLGCCASLDLPDLIAEGLQYALDHFLGLTDHLNFYAP